MSSRSVLVLGFLVLCVVHADQHNLPPAASPPSDPAATESYVKLECLLCDLLIEEVFIEAQVDFDKEKAETLKTITKDDVSEGKVVIQVPLHQTTARMLYPEREEHERSPRWEAFQTWSTTFQTQAKESLENLQHELEAPMHMLEAGKGRSKLMKIKNEVCGKQCELLFGPRKPSYRADDCGQCMEVMRDVALIWIRKGTKDKKSLNTVLEDVCDNAELRYSGKVLEEIQIMCEEITDNYRGAIKQCLLEGPKDTKQDKDDAHAFQIIAGHLSKVVCMSEADHCSEKELKSQAGNLTPVSKDLFYLGMARAD